MLVHDSVNILGGLSAVFICQAHEGLIINSMQGRFNNNEQDCVSPCERFQCSQLQGSHTVSQSHVTHRDCS